MSVLTRREPTGQMKDKMIPSFTAPTPLGRSRRFLPKDKPHARYEDEGCERLWGVGLKKFEAEDLLDWLEANGRKGTLSYVAGKGFTVR
jgi:hypothetical protein